MGRVEETYIVRVRRDEGDAVVEDVRSGQRGYVRDLAAVGALIASKFSARKGADPDATDQTKSGEEQLR